MPDAIDDTINAALPFVRECLEYKEQRILVKTMMFWNIERNISAQRGLDYFKGLNEVQLAVLKKVCAAAETAGHVLPNELAAIKRAGLI